jgi:methionyl-tRNA formyltransferase
VNIFLCGQRSFGKAVLEELLNRGHTIVGVAPPPQVKQYDKMQVFAIKAGLPILSDCERLVSANIPDNTDLVVAAHSHWYISAKVIAKARLGAVGFHPSLLPRHRGQDAVRWAVQMRDAITGASVYWLNDKVDGGDIIAQAPVFIAPGWDYHRLWREIFPVGVKMLCDAVDDIGSGLADRKPQDERFATFEPSFNPPRLKRNELTGLPG